MGNKRRRHIVCITLCTEAKDRIDAIALLSGETRSACIERLILSTKPTNNTNKRVP
jgi:hypothetical protein